jgi:hypothetical protein
MKLRHVVAVAAVAAVALVATGCGDENDCPTEAAAVEPGQSMADAGKCTAPAPQQVRITLELCEQCSRTGATCSAQRVSADQIFLDTSWEICEENRSCSGEACSQVACIISVPEGTYTVSTLDASGSTRTFELDVNGGTASCSGTI